MCKRHRPPLPAEWTQIAMNREVCLGSELGKSLDRADRLAQSQATQTALEGNPTGTPTTWTNLDTGHMGKVTPVKTFESAGRPCREFTQTIMIDGKTETVTGQACRDGQGWGLQP